MFSKRLLKITRVYLSRIQQGSFRFRCYMFILLTASALFYFKSHYPQSTGANDNIPAKSAARNKYHLNPKHPDREYHLDALVRREASKHGNHKPGAASSIIHLTEIIQEAVKNYNNNILRLDESTAQLSNAGREEHESISTVRRDVKRPNVESKSTESPVANVRSLKGINFEILTDRELEHLLFGFLLHNEIMCSRTKRFGRLADGGLDLCDDVGVRVKDPCIVYSIETNLNLTFEEAIAEKLKCSVSLLTPRVHNGAVQKRSDKITIYNGRLSTRTEKNGTAMTFSRFLSLVRHQRTPIDVLALDLNGAEWDLLPHMLNSKDLFRVRQLLVEFHLLAIDRKYILPKLKLLQALEKAGFKKFYTKHNRVCELVVGNHRRKALCYKVGFIFTF
ncbi:unnamed protein product [Lymnaea stagnalis]|uniref:Methyltransferase domain-containing protein n=1 Tax=Lymnaea stagnalis TaxID=6523 RepID=A0AAV2I9V6_LYMST